VSDRPNYSRAVGRGGSLCFVIIVFDSMKNAQARHSSDAFKQSYDARKPMSVLLPWRE
jgi:hypothetical protein